MRRIAFILLLLYSLSLPARNVRFVNYGADDGLPSLSVYAVAQDADGFLWVGTRGGLCRFDGVRFRTVLPGKRVTSLAVDGDNRVWAGTTDGLVVRTPGQTGEDTALPGKHVRALLTDSDGYVWAATLDSLLLKLTFDGGVREVARTRYKNRYFEGDYPYQQIYEDPQGRIWCGGRLVNCQYVSDREHPSTERVREYINIGSYAAVGNTLYAFDDYYNELCVVSPPENRGVGRLPVAHARLLTDSRGRLWAAGSYGLGLVDPERPEETTVYKHRADDPSSLASSELYCLFEDRQGNLWAGGDNGLSVLCPALQQVLVPDLPSSQVTALLQASDGRLWVGTADAGAFILDDARAIAGHVDYRPAGRPNEGHVSCLYEDSEGAVYIGLYAGCGFNIWKDGRVRRGFVSGPVPVEQHGVAEGDRITSNWINDFLEGRDGRFWVVTWEGVGLNEWDRKTGRTLPVEWLSPFWYPTPEKDSSVYLSSRLGSRLIEDAAGNLVYGTTEAGLNVIDRRTRRVTKYLPNPADSLSLPDNYITDLCLAPDGTLWAATHAGLWSPSGKRFLQGKMVLSVRCDAQGRIWAGTEEGLYFIDTDGSIGVVRKGLGFPSDIYGEHAACTLSDGRLAFGGPSGMAVFHPDSLLALKASGNLLLEPLVLHRYRLNDEEWVYERFAGLPDHIQPGRYTLEEQSSDIFGRWERGGTASRQIRVPLPLWLHWPFLLLYALLMASAVWLIIRLRERRLLVKELDMRNHLFSIISHDLRNPVSGNRLLARQLLEKADNLSPDQMKECLQVLSHSVDNTSALLENLLLWSLSQKGMLEPVMRDEDLLPLANEAVESLQKKEVIQVEIPEGLHVRTDRNMLLTCLRNLLDNAVKATPEGGKVLLQARGKTISVTDRGPGMQEGATPWGHGLGLVITRELLEKMGASLQASNRPEGGLEITIHL